MFHPRIIVLFGIVALFFFLTGCAPVVVGGAAVGGYKMGTDERTTNQMAEDANLSTAVKNRLADDSLGTAYRIDVDVVEGHVTLSGVVKSTEEANRAVRLAKTVQGVKGVRNNLQVGDRSFSDAMSDSWVSSKVKSALVAEPGVRSLNIDVDVYLGVVTLTGLVNSQTERTKALAVARRIEGVKRVVDNLKVR